MKGVDLVMMVSLGAMVVKCRSFLWRAEAGDGGRQYLYRKNTRGNGWDGWRNVRYLKPFFCGGVWIGIVTVVVTL